MKIRGKMFIGLVICLILGAITCGFASANSSNLSDEYDVFVVTKNVTLPGDSYPTATFYFGLKDKSGNIVIPATYSGMKLYKDHIIAAGKGVNYGGLTGPGLKLPQYGLINLKQNVITPFQYDDIEPLAKEKQLVRCENYVYDPIYSTGYLKTSKNSLYGIMTESGTIILNPCYYEIESLSQGYFKVSNTHNADAKAGYGSFGHVSYLDNKWGVCDASGKLIIPVAYDSIKYLEDGLFAVEKSGKFGIINNKNQVIIPIQYAGVHGRYKDSFIVSKYTSEDYAREAIAHPNNKPYWGDLWTRQGIIGADNQILIGFDKYQTITVDDNGKFACGIWTGETELVGAIYGSSYKSYRNIYTYDYVEYNDLKVTVTLQDLSSPFTDVETNAYYFAPVKWAIKNHITAGTTETTFSPNSTCTTAQILTFLWRSKGQPEPTIANPFVDVSQSDYYYKAALWAYEKGLVSEESFNGNKPCTRGQTVTYLWELKGSPNAGKSVFTDAGEYSDAIAWAVQTGITNGTTSTTFSPNNTCTRGQIVTFLYRAIA